MKKKSKYFAAALALALSLSGCGSDNYVPVQRVDTLTAAAVAADRFAGEVVSESAVTVAREADKTVADLLVAVGDQVSKGQKLFSYDSDELSLTLDKQELELDQLEVEIDNLEDQIAAVAKELKSATGDTKTQLNIQQRQLQMELTEAEYEETALKQDITYTKQMLADVHVYSPIEGTIRSISTDNYDQYIVIQQAGAYQIKGLLSEMNMSMGLMEGVSVQITSRLDPEQTWTGVITSVDYENPETGGYDNYYGVSSGLTSASSYPFYVELDSTDGLLLGQHVYIQMASWVPDSDGVYIPEDYLMDLLYTPETDATTASVWAVGSDGRLEKRTVTLGLYESGIASYCVLDGLDLDDYIADPANLDCKEGAEISIDGKTGYIDDSGLTAAEQESIAASIAADIENAE